MLLGWNFKSDEHRDSYYMHGVRTRDVHTKVVDKCACFANGFYACYVSSTFWTRWIFCM